MSVEFDEYHSYTVEQTKGHIDDARVIVESLDLPADLRPIAFESAVKLLSQKAKVPRVPEALKGIHLGPNHG